jgi:hypothetical protein
LQQAKSQVLATPALKANFESALNFIAQFLDDKKYYDSGNRGNQRNVVSVTRGQNTGRGGPGRGHGRTGGRTGRGRGQRSGRANLKVEDKYCPYAEWVKLSPEQQQKVRDLKADRDKRRNVQPVERNVKQRSDIEANNNEAVVQTKQSEVGAMMSQRKPINREL